MDIKCGRWKNTCLPQWQAVKKVHFRPWQSQCITACIVAPCCSRAEAEYSWEKHCNSPLSSKLSLIFVTLFSLTPPFLHIQLLKASYPSPCLTLPVPVFSFTPSLMSLSHPLQPHFSLPPPLSTEPASSLNLSPHLLSFLMMSRELFLPFTFFLLLRIAPSLPLTLSLLLCFFFSHFFFFFFLLLTSPVTNRARRRDIVATWPKTKRPDWSGSAV